MSSPAPSIRDLFGLVVKEGRPHLLMLAMLFSVISLGALAVGMILPKRWNASTVLLAESSNILQPLMEGRAVTTGISDQTAIVTQIVLSRRILREIVAFGGMRQPSNAKEEELQLEQLKSRIRIDSPRKEMIRISFSGADPKQVYQITNRLAEIYVRESTAAKERESREAFDFIAKQVKEYGDKLAAAHEQVLAYYVGQESGRGTSDRTHIPSPGAPGAPQLKISPEELAGLRAEEALLTARLGRRPAAAPRTDAPQVEEQARSRANQLQQELDRLETSYTDEHPDVKRVKRSLATAKEELHVAEQARIARERASVAAAAAEDEVTPAARARLEEVQRKIAAATGRRRPATTPSGRSPTVEATIDPEMRGVGHDTTLSELLRRYEATRDVYQDLLKRRENARVSMDLDAEHRGLTLRIQERAEIPVIPSSMRVLHFGVIGLVLGVLVPLALLLAIIRLDPRVRSPWQIQRFAHVPLLVRIPYAEAPHEKSRHRNRRVLAALMVAGVFAVYATFFLINLKTS
jgi:polysaccharide chain length determinant protein (PEP-CTERM system associated)